MPPLEPAEPSPRPTTRVILVVLVVLAAIVGGYFALAKYQSRWPFKEDTTSWQTYRDKEFGFEFKYPFNWGIKDATEYNRGLTGFDFDLFFCDGIPCTGGVGLGGNIRVRLSGYKNINISDQELINKFTNQGPIQQGKKSFGILSFNEYVFSGFKWEITENKKVKVIWEKENYTREDLFNQILSTFKFIEAQINISNWKTYRNTKYGYEFKYPDNVGTVSEYDSSFLGPPNNPNEDLLLISDKEKTFHFQISQTKVSVIKDSPLSQKILSTFRFTK